MFKLKNLLFKVSNAFSRPDYENPVDRKAYLEKNPVYKAYLEKKVDDKQKVFDCTKDVQVYGAKRHDEPAIRYDPADRKLNGFISGASYHYNFDNDFKYSPEQIRKNTGLLWTNPKQLPSLPKSSPITESKSQVKTNYNSPTRIEQPAQAKIEELTQASPSNASQPQTGIEGVVGISESKGHVPKDRGNTKSLSDNCGGAEYTELGGVAHSIYGGVRHAWKSITSGKSQHNHRSYVWLMEHFSETDRSFYIKLKEAIAHPEELLAKQIELLAKEEIKRAKKREEDCLISCEPMSDQQPDSSKQDLNFSNKFSVPAGMSTY